VCGGSHIEAGGGAKSSTGEMHVNHPSPGAAKTKATFWYNPLMNRRKFISGAVGASVAGFLSKLASGSPEVLKGRYRATERLLPFIGEVGPPTVVGYIGGRIPIIEETVDAASYSVSN
jgi:hypothetical protein